MIWFIVGLFVGAFFGFLLAPLLAAAADPGPSDLNGPWMDIEDIPAHMWQRRIP